MKKNKIDFKMTKGIGLFLRSGAVIAAVLMMVRCSSSKNDSDSTTASPTLTWLYTNVFSVACVKCHTAALSASNASGSTLDFSSIATTYQTLGLMTSANSVIGSAGCSGIKLINGSDPATSFIVAMVVAQYNQTGFVNAGCTPPKGHVEGGYMKTYEQNALIQWIQNGASNN